MFQLPTSSRLFRVLEPGNEWGWQEVLLNKVAHFLEILQWQKSNQGLSKSKQTPPPKPFVPDFLKHLFAGEANKKDLVSYDTRTIDDILARPRL